MELLSQASDTVEIYSIDEAFLMLDHLEEAHHLRKKVLQWTGIPLSIGLSSTKTLAKVAALIAKDKKEGVYRLDDSEIEKVLAKLPVRRDLGSRQKSGEASSGARDHKRPAV